MQFLSEDDLQGIVQEAGGSRAYQYADQQISKNADFLLGDAIIELKQLNDEGFSKPERQRKLAELFLAIDNERPVVVLDPAALDDEGRKKYRGIVEGPIKGAIAKARKQLLQSRLKFPSAQGSILWVVNNGYMSLDDETLKEIVTNRARQDTSQIDGIIVSGCYFHSDGFEGPVLFPITYIPLNTGFGFSAFKNLHSSWNAFAGRFMTAVVRGEQAPGLKQPINDIYFDLDGVRYIRPSPSLGQPSDFFVNGRPRKNSSGINICPPVALVVPELTRADHALVLATADEPNGPLASYEEWQAHIDEAKGASSPLKPLVTIPVSSEDWLIWCKTSNISPSLNSLRNYSLEKFQAQIAMLIENATERKNDSVVLSSYVLAITEEIGRDQANDVSHIVAVREHPDGRSSVRPIVANLRIFHEHAVALAAAYSFGESKDSILWQIDERYSWK